MCSDIGRMGVITVLFKRILYDQLTQNSCDLNSKLGILTP